MCLQGFGKGPEGTMSQGTPRPKWQENVKTDLEEKGWRHRLDWSVFYFVVYMSNNQ
jgi:hypothetical protein